MTGWPLGVGPRKMGETSPHPATPGVHCPKEAAGLEKWSLLLPVPSPPPVWVTLHPSDSGGGTGVPQALNRLWGSVPPTPTPMKSQEQLPQENSSCPSSLHSGWAGLPDGLSQQHPGTPLEAGKEARFPVGGGGTPLSQMKQGAWRGRGQTGHGTLQGVSECQKTNDIDFLFVPFLGGGA